MSVIAPLEAVKPEQPRTTEPDEGRPPLQRSELYPQQELPIVSDLDGEADDFDLIREDLIFDRTLNTARAYWGDLEYWRDWCLAQQPAIQPLTPATADIQHYLDELGELDYSPNTRARRLTTLRAFYRMVALQLGVNDPSTGVGVVRRRNGGVESSGDTE